MLVSDSFGIPGGIALYTRDLIAAVALADTVTEVVVVSLWCARDPGKLPPKVRLVGSGNGTKTAWVAAASQLVAEQFDLVICGHAHLLKVAAVLNLFWRAPLVLMVYGVEAWPRYGSRFMALLLRRVSVVWSISRFTRDQLAAWSTVDPRDVVVLPNAVDLRHFSHREPNIDLRSRLGLDGREVLLTVARLARVERYKGLDRIIAVLPALRQKHPSLAYLIVGDGEDRDYLEAEAKRHGVGEHVIFAGNVDEATKIDCFHLADAFAMTGTGEGLGFVYLEAMACGLPTVGSAVDGARDALRDGQLGWLADPNSSDQITKAIFEALASARKVPEGLSYFDWPNFVTRAGEAIAAATDQGGSRDE